MWTVAAYSPASSGSSNRWLLPHGGAPPRGGRGSDFGETVSVTARIAEYARQGEVLVSKAVADASQEKGLAFGDIGPVELKGVSGTVHLLRDGAHRNSPEMLIEIHHL